VAVDPGDRLADDSTFVLHKVLLRQTARGIR
jgi:hypothetical protein